VISLPVSVSFNSPATGAVKTLSSTIFSGNVVSGHKRIASLPRTILSQFAATTSFNSLLIVNLLLM
jgi:hypothetical protein